MGSVSQLHEMSDSLYLTLSKNVDLLVYQPCVTRHPGPTEVTAHGIRRCSQSAYRKAGVNMVQIKFSHIQDATYMGKKQELETMLAV